MKRSKFTDAQLSQNLFLRLAILVSAFVTSSAPQAAIYVDPIEYPKKVVIIKIEGRIEHEDEIEFKRVLDQIKRDGYEIKLNSVVLNTRGGNVGASVEIGKIIRKEKLNTYVGPRHQCGSSCIFILSSGIIRMAYGKVSVHRSFFGDEYPIEKIEKPVVNRDAVPAAHLYEMGMTTQLVDAIKVTPYWTSRKLTEKEKRGWGVHGTERLYEELWFRTTAQEKHYDSGVVRNFYVKHATKCNKMAREFKMTVFDCVKAEM